MATRKPLVQVGGQIQELPVGDTVEGAIGDSPCAVYSGQWLSTASTGPTSANSTNPLGTLRMAPMRPARSLTIDQLAILTTTAGTGGTNAARLVVYASNAAGWPDALLATATVTGLNAVGQFGAALSVATLTLQAGQQYWLGIHGDFSSTHRQVTAASLAHLGYASGSASPYLCLSRTLAYASGTPDTFAFTPADLATFNPTEIRMRLV